MKVENIIKALEHQRAVILTQNVELMAENMALKEENEMLKKNSAAHTAEAPDTVEKK